MRQPPDNPQENEDSDAESESEVQLRGGDIFRHAFHSEPMAVVDRRVGTEEQQGYDPVQCDRDFRITLDDTVLQWNETVEATMRYFGCQYRTARIAANNAVSYPAASFVILRIARRRSLR